MESQPGVRQLQPVRSGEISTRHDERSECKADRAQPSRKAGNPCCHNEAPYDVVGISHDHRAEDPVVRFTSSAKARQGKDSEDSCRIRGRFSRRLSVALDLWIAFGLFDQI